MGISRYGMVCVRVVSVAAADFIPVPPLPRISGLLAVAQPGPSGFSWSRVFQSWAVL